MSTQILQATGTGTMLQLTVTQHTQDKAISSDTTDVTSNGSHNCKLKLPLAPWRVSAWAYHMHYARQSN